MKAKRIALVYVKGFIENVASVEKAFNAVIGELVLEGKVVQASTSSTTRFTDGTTVTKIPFGSGQLKGNRLTHLYIDEKIFDLPSGKEYVNEALKPLVINGGVYNNLDAEGSPADRIMTFSLNGFGKLKGDN